MRARQVNSCHTALPACPAQPPAVCTATQPCTAASLSRGAKGSASQPSKVSSRKEAPALCSARSRSAEPAQPCAACVWLPAETARLLPIAVCGTCCSKRATRGGLGPSPPRPSSAGVGGSGAEMSLWGADCARVEEKPAEGHPVSLFLAAVPQSQSPQLQAHDGEAPLEPHQPCHI